MTMALKNKVPKTLRGPIGFGSLGVMILGLVVGYIFTVAGLTIYFGLGSGPADVLNGSIDALLISAVGLVCIAVGFLGWKSFNYFAY